MVKSTRRLLVSIFLVIIALGNILIYSSYSHVHRINGQWVVHSHPYDTQSDKQPVKNHKHTLSEIVLLAQAKQFEENSQSQACNPEIAVTRIHLKTAVHHLQVALQLKPNRAPPLV